jgi:hypothetical protein
MTRKIVDVLREWKKVDEEYNAVAAQMKGLEVADWDDEIKDIYLRGYDDAKTEMANLEMLLREAEDENAYAWRRVRELESTLLDEHSRLAQEEAQPASVALLEAVRWGHLRNGQLLARVFDTLRDATLCEAHEVRVVALVDPAQLVPLASAEPAKWTSETGHSVNYKQGHVCNIPLYPGLAQPEQEGDG